MARGLIVKLNTLCQFSVLCERKGGAIVQPLVMSLFT